MKLYNKLSQYGFDPYQKIKPANKKNYNGDRSNTFINDEVGMIDTIRCKGKIMKYRTLFYLFYSKELIWFRVFEKYGLRLLMPSLYNKKYKLIILS